MFLRTLDTSPWLLNFLIKSYHIVAFNHAFRLLSNLSCWHGKFWLFSWISEAVAFRFPQSPKLWAVSHLQQVVFSFHTLRNVTLREKCLNTEFFLVRIFLYSVQIEENTDQKKLRIWTLFTYCNVVPDCSRQLYQI